MGIVFGRFAGLMARKCLHVSQVDTVLQKCVVQLCGAECNRKIEHWLWTLDYQTSPIFQSSSELSISSFHSVDSASLPICCSVPVCFRRQNWLPLIELETMSMTDYIRHIEAIIYATKEPVNSEQIAASLSETLDLSLTDEDIRAKVEQLMEKYSADDFVFEIAEIDGGYVFLTKGQYHKTIEDYLKVSGKKKLSRAALETLAIIAYKQPITKGEVEEIRGVSVDYTIKKLLEKELVDIRGRSDAPGRPIIYETSERFMDYFGLKSKKDLPKLKDIVADNESIGKQIEIEKEKKNS